MMDLQLIFQDPYSSLNPAFSIRRIVEEPLRIYGKYSAAERKRRAEEMLEAVGLGPEFHNRKPAQLSGGQRQRIAIARAMLKNAPVVILDEATAYIDPENEAVVQRAVAKLVEGKTVIVIAHRLSTITGADQIVVAKDGSIEAQGRHEELLRHCPLYADLWQAHMGVKEGETV